MSVKSAVDIFGNDPYPLDRSALYESGGGAKPSDAKPLEESKPTGKIVKRRRIKASERAQNRMKYRREKAMKRRVNRKWRRSSVGRRYLKRYAKAVERMGDRRSATKKISLREASETDQQLAKLARMKDADGYEVSSSRAAILEAVTVIGDHVTVVMAGLASLYRNVEDFAFRSDGILESVENVESGFNDISLGDLRACYESILNVHKVFVGDVRKCVAENERGN